MESPNLFRFLYPDWKDHWVKRPVPKKNKVKTTEATRLSAVERLLGFDRKTLKWQMHNTARQRGGDPSD